MGNEEEVYTLTTWGCLQCILEDYGVDTSHITGAIGMHLMDDLFDLLAKCGYLEKKEEQR